MKKQIMLSCAIFIALSISSINYLTEDNYKNNDLKLSSLFSHALADGESTCASPGDYFSNGMQPCSTVQYCYNGGEVCGEQKCCEPYSTQNSCTDYECDE